MKIHLKVVLIALYFFKGKFPNFYPFNIFICILTKIKLILTSSLFDLD